MKSEVYYTKAGAEHFNDSIVNRLEKLFDRAGGGSAIKENDLVAVKGHFGEPGNVTFISPVFYRAVIERIKLCGGNPFLTDTNTLYTGERNNAVLHSAAAVKHGFSFATAGAPVIIADGLRGTDFIEVPVNGKHMKRAKIASAIYHADSVVFITHAKMHMVSSYGGAIKNIGMGCASRGGKQEQHSGGVPGVDEERCTGCGDCVSWCNENAITLKNKKAVIDGEKCVGCGECIAVCNYDATHTKWDGSSEDLQEKMAEYSCAALSNKKGRSFFLNFVMNVTPDCDCLPSSGRYVIPDFGILASLDPVAIDTAAADIICSSPAIKENLDNKKFDKKQASKDNFRAVNPGLDWKVQLDYAEELGLGTKKYELIEVK